MLAERGAWSLDDPVVRWLPDFPRDDISLRELEDRYIHEVLNATGQNKTHAARILGIHPTSLLRRLKKTPELV